MAITADITLAQRPVSPTVETSITALNGEGAADWAIIGRAQRAAMGDAPAFSKLATPSAESAGWRALSIFSGCGGLDLGFLQQGVLSGAAFDIDRKALSTYNNNLPSVAVHADLASSSPVPGAGPILLAGAPCQGFSTAGRRNVEDPRNALLMRIADIALENDSKVIVVENVPAAFSVPHRSLWVALEDRLRLAGYNVRRLLLEGRFCGLAQRRSRLFLLCWRGSDCINVEIRNRPALTLREALHGVGNAVDNDAQWPKTGSRDWMIARRIPAGHKLSNVRRSERAVATWEIPEVYGATSHRERNLLSAVARLRRRQRVRSNGDGDPVHVDRLAKELGQPVDQDIERLLIAGYLRAIGDCVELRQTYNGRYRRLEWDAPSPTVDTKFGRMDLFLHPDEHRGMTAREAARIQGFPDGFRFFGSTRDKFTQIGNAVPPPMASALAEFIREAILKA